MTIINRLVLALLITALAMTTAQADTTIVFNSFFPPQNFINTKVLPRWAHDVEAATHGRVRVVIPPKSVAPPDQLWEAISNGLCDAGYLYNGFLPKRVNLPLIAQLPGLTTSSSETMSVALWKTYQKYFQSRHQYSHDFKVLSLFVASPAEFYSISDHPFTTARQIDKAKIWALPGPTARMLQNAGIPVVGGPAAQIQEFVSHGVVDAFTGISYVAADAFKASPYVTSVTTFKRPLFAPGFSVVIRRAKWQSLSKTDRQAIERVSGEHLARLIGSQYDREDRKARQALVHRGVRFVAAAPALEKTFKKAGKPLFQAWEQQANREGVNAKAAIAYYRKQFGQ